MFCSFLIPSRGRPLGLMKTVLSINEATKFHDEIEMFLRLDDDDPTANPDFINDIRREARFPVHVKIGARGEGYVHLHHFINEMAKNARGRWLWLFNDDSTIETKDWDYILRGVEFNLPPRFKDMAIIRCSYPYSDGRKDKYNPNNIFPIVRRSMTQLLGHYSRTMYNDAYVDTIGKRAGTIRTCGWCPTERRIVPPEIIVGHHMVHDVVRKESEKQYVWKLPPEEQEAVDRGQLEDIEKVKNYLEGAVQLVEP
jgi:hypothetical protein